MRLVDATEPGAVLPLRSVATGRRKRVGEYLWGMKEVDVSGARIRSFGARNGGEGGDGGGWGGGHNNARNNGLCWWNQNVVRSRTRVEFLCWK